MMQNNVRIITQVENGKLLKILEYETGAKVKIPINKNGTIKWYEDKPKEVQ